MRGLVREIAEPDEVLSRVNELLIGGESLNDFATAMLVRLRREELRLGPGARRGRPPAGGARQAPAGRNCSAAARCSGAWPEPNVAAPRADAERRRDARLCTDGWLEAGPVASHQGPEAFGEMTQALSGWSWWR